MMYEYLLIIMNSGDNSWSSDTKESQAEDFGYFFSCSLREIFLSSISLTSKSQILIQAELLLKLNLWDLIPLPPQRAVNVTLDVSDILLYFRFPGSNGKLLLLCGW